MKTTSNIPLTEQKLNDCSKEELLSLCKLLMENNKKLSTQLDYLTQQIVLSNHRRFGSSSEKDQIPEGYDQISMCFNEAEATTDSSAAEPQYEEVVPKPYKRKKQKGKREADLANFPVVQIEHKLSAEECVCHDKLVSGTEFF